MSGSHVRAADPSVHNAPPSVRVRVRLFGALAGSGAGSIHDFEFDRTATVGAVLDELCARMDESFRSSVLDETGRKHRYCRLFLNGDCVEDSQTTLASGNHPNQIEMILLVAREGG